MPILERERERERERESYTCSKGQIDNLRKRKVWILNWCYMCKCNGESIDHLFLHCPVAMDMWSMVFRVSWAMSQFVVGLLACWQGRFGRHRNGHIWLIVPRFLMWCFWRERNNRCLKIMRDSYQTSSYFSLELYRIGWLLCETNHSFFFFLISLILVIFVLELLTLCTLHVLGCSIFDINKTYYLSKKCSEGQI